MYVEYSVDANSSTIDLNTFTPSTQLKPDTSEDHKHIQATVCYNIFCINAAS
jgi:hypothetical protein